MEMAKMLLPMQSVPPAMAKIHQCNDDFLNFCMEPPTPPDCIFDDFDDLPDLPPSSRFGVLIKCMKLQQELEREREIKKIKEEMMLKTLQDWQILHMNKFANQASTLLPGRTSAPVLTPPTPSLHNPEDNNSKHFRLGTDKNVTAIANNKEKETKIQLQLQLVQERKSESNQVRDSELISETKPEPKTNPKPEAEPKSKPEAETEPIPEQELDLDWVAENIKYNKAEEEWQKMLREEPEPAVPAWKSSEDENSERVLSFKSIELSPQWNKYLYMFNLRFSNANSLSDFEFLNLKFSEMNPMQKYVMSKFFTVPESVDRMLSGTIIYDNIHRSRKFIEQFRTQQKARSLLKSSQDSGTTNSCRPRSISSCTPRTNLNSEENTSNQQNSTSQSQQPERNSDQNQRQNDIRNTLIDHSYHANEPECAELMETEQPESDEEEIEIDVVSYFEKQTYSHPVQIQRNEAVNLVANANDINSVQIQRNEAVNVVADTNDTSPPSPPSSSSSSSRASSPAPSSPPSPPSPPRRPRGRPPGRTSRKRKRNAQESQDNEVASPAPRRRRVQNNQRTCRRQNDIQQNQDGESDDEETQRRRMHNSLERERRLNLRNAFDTLRINVPEIANNSKTSKVKILESAAIHVAEVRAVECQDMQSKQNLLTEKKRFLKICKQLLNMPRKARAFKSEYP